MKAITADLPHIHSHLLITYFHAARLCNNDPMELQTSPSYHDVPVITS
ncbi:hypothetical protein H238_5424 [Klebsiella pneumoniae UHKPC179]|nr:hypothetical protein CSC13_0914 [Klebsiella pneumoniae]EPA89351.1 hypothetical protein H237_5508 [Klebsiella pneumoniae UHKPC57]EPO87808.1 hypothetical protein H238_5424 [Klebsiella pneumoniae UHKPC179]CDL17869.1 hypothetical protein [Klebsiella pneumoniae IS46]